jgi:hypothetical protein
MTTEILAEKTESADQTAIVAPVATEEINPVSALLHKKADSLMADGKAKKLADVTTLGAKLSSIADNEENRFKSLMQALGLYVIVGNSEEIAKLEGDISKAKDALVKAGFPEDSDIVKSAIKGLSAELEKSRKSTKDNLSDLANFFGVKLAKNHAPYASTGDLAMRRYAAGDIQKNDWLIKDGDKTAIVCHSSTLADEVLAPFNVKPGSENYLMFVYNGDLQYTSVTSNVPGESEKIATITNYPQTYLEVKPLRFELDSLSGFEKTCVLALRGLKATDAAAQKIARNGWQSNSRIDGQAKIGVKRVTRTNG